MEKTKEREKRKGKVGAQKLAYLPKGHSQEGECKIEIKQVSLSNLRPLVCFR